MVGTLCWEDVSDLSIFKCKICKHRLQHPVMEVQTLGCICGSCYERSAFTNVTENTDIETILSKLCIPCKYSERGCYFDGSFKKTSEHEKQSCPFRDKLCPFALLNQCEIAEIENVIEHIKKEHEDYFINAVVEENYLTIDDPLEMKCTKTNPDTFHLFEYENKQFLFHCKIDVKEQIYNYLLYYFNNDDNSDQITFSLVVEQFNLISKSKISAVPYLELAKTHENVLALSATMLANLGCAKKLKILLNFEDDKKDLQSNKILNWFKCAVCTEDIIDAVHLCESCNNTVCRNCYKNATTCSDCESLYRDSLHLCMVHPEFKIKCKTIGCDELIRKDEYELHKENCQFKIYECCFRKTNLDCEWTGFYTDIAKHVLREHNEYAYVNRMSISPNTNDSTNFTRTIVIKNKITIRCRYHLNTNGQLSLKIGVIGPMDLEEDNLYVWELHLNDGKTLKSTVISCICGQFDENGVDFDEIIDVSNYLIDDKLQFEIIVNHIM